MATEAKPTPANGDASTQSQEMGSGVTGNENLNDDTSLFEDGGEGNETQGNENATGSTETGAPGEGGSNENLEGGASEEEEGPQYTTDDLAQIFGLAENPFDVSEDGKLLVKAKIDGGETTAKFDDLLSSYQLKGHLDNETRKVAERQRELDARMAETGQQVQQQMQTAQDLIDLAWNQLNEEFNNVDWAGLRSEDEAAFAAKHADFQNRQTQIQTAYSQLQETRQQQQQEQANAIQNYAREEHKRLVSLVPQWADNATYQKETSEIQDHIAKTYGVPREQVVAGTHWQADVARKALLWDKLQAEKAAVSKKVTRKPPRVARPGANPKPKPKTEDVPMEDVFYPD